MIACVLITTNAQMGLIIVTRMLIAQIYLVVFYVHVMMDLEEMVKPV